MDNSLLIKKNTFYSSWIVLAVFVFILIFQPTKATFYAIRPSDIWLLFCLFYQLKNGYNITIHFRNRFLIRNYGLFIGVLAIIATLLQASYANISLDISFIFQFYRFLRFLLIFKFVENIFFNFSSDDVKKFWKAYTLMGLVIIILSFLEFNNIQPFKSIIMDQYYYLHDDTIEEYLIKVERLAGVMGNANATAILLVSTLPYPLLRIGNEGGRFIKKFFYIVYVFTVVYVLIVMTASRTAIFTSLFVLLFMFISASRSFKEISMVFVLTLLLALTGVFIYYQFGSDIKVQDRITNAFRGENIQLSDNGMGEWAAHYDLWRDRLKTFKNEGNQLSMFLGMGYTRAYNETTDNGLISAFINNGLTGLILKLFLFYIFIKFGLLRAIHYYRWNEIDISSLAFAISAFAFLLWESTADMTEHYKLGQLFYLFLSIVMIINGKIFLTNSK